MDNSRSGYRMQDYTAILQARRLHSNPPSESAVAAGTSSPEGTESHAEEILRDVAVQAPASPPPLPEGVRLVLYAPKKPPVAIEQCSVVTNVDLFIRTTLADLEIKLNDTAGVKGGWTVPQMMDRLRQVGLVLEITKA